MQQNPQWQPRSRVAVNLKTFDGESLEGFIFVPSDMRVSDILDSPRPFLPFVDGDGGFCLIAKSTITRLTPDDDQAHRARRVRRASRKKRLESAVVGPDPARA